MMTNIGLGIICPTKYLEDFAVQSPYHLVLTHKVFNDPAYAEFYRYRARMGDFVTLDNSSYEVGDGVFTNKDLFEAAGRCGASEIMAPETYMDARDTYHKVAAFVEYFSNRVTPIRTFATLHGRDITEIMWLNKKYLQMQVGTIGISCRLDPFDFDHANDAYRLSVGRAKIVQRLEPVWKASWWKPEYHLLGMNHPAEISFYRNIRMIRSCDSSAAFINGLHEKSINVFDYEKPKDRVDFDYTGLPNSRRFFVNDNIEYLKKWGKRNDIES